MSRLLEEYNNQIKKELQSKLGLKNLFEVPKLKKIMSQKLNFLKTEHLNDLTELNALMSEIETLVGDHKND